MRDDDDDDEEDDDDEDDDEEGVRSAVRVRPRAPPSTRVSE